MNKSEDLCKDSFRQILYSGLSLQHLTLMVRYPTNEIQNSNNFSFILLIFFEILKLFRFLSELKMILIKTKAIYLDIFSLKI